MLEAIITILTSLLWGYVYLLMSFLDLIWTGPKNYFNVKTDASPPAELTDKKYGDHRFLNIGKVKLHYVISGPEDAPLMIMVHGFPEVWYTWRHQIVEFQKDFRVVAINMRGYADSDKPEGVKNYKIDFLVEDLKLFINGLGYKSCVLMAHDWGGTVSWAFASRYPDMVSRLIVLNMCPGPLWWKTITSNILQYLGSGYIFFFFLPRIPEFVALKNDFNLLYRMFNWIVIGMKSRKMSDTDLECFKYYFRREGAITPCLNYYRANIRPPSIHHSLKYLMPVHIVWGMDDLFLTPTLLEETCKVVPHASVSRIKNCSHWIQNDQPEKVCEAVREFIKTSEFDMKSHQKNESL